ncbi:MAG: hypothetical protein QHC40_07575 [Sphingobium sp.]|nr:hypothetical protein [Sphingobium sp.]
MRPRAVPGRPLRFFGALLLLWIGARVAFNLPLPQPAEATAEPPLAMARPIPLLTAHAARVAVRSAPVARFTAFAALIPSTRLMKQPPETSRGETDDAMPIDLLDFIHFSVAFANRHHGSGALAGGGLGATAALALAPAPLAPPRTVGAPTDRWRLSAWTLWRPDGPGSDFVASPGQLGGSQAGARLEVDLIPAARQRLSAYARATTALGRPAAPEAAVGLALQPSRRIPVSVAIERRVALGPGARDAMAVMAVGGFGPSPLAPGLLAEGYGQAGIVGFRRGDGFVDGKVNLLAPIGDGPVRLGASLSGGAQPRVHRVDIGPEVQLRLPLPAAAARLSVEWRERVAGNARPPSGLAVTLAADF